MSKECISNVYREHWLTMVRKFADQAENIVSLTKLNLAARAPARAGRAVRIFMVMIYDTAKADQAKKAS